VATELVGNSKFMDRALIHATNFGNLLKPEEGAFNQVWAATAPREKLENGMYYEPVGKLAWKKLDRTARDDGLAKRLWEWTEEALKGH
jgi:hypothetical protein